MTSQQHHHQFSLTNLLPHDPLQLREAPAMPLPSSFGAASPGLPHRAGTASPDSMLHGGHAEDDYPDQPYAIALPDRTVAATDSAATAADDPSSFDLKPPPPSSNTQENVEELSLRFFSRDHLDTILRNQRFSRRFASFLANFKPHLLPALTAYLDFQKAIVAVEYANAISESLSSNADSDGLAAAALNDSFEAKSTAPLQQLVDDALPAYLTHRLVQIVTDTLVKEVTGQGTPLMRDMIPSLAEVYCLSDPSNPDNPIVYASEEFYRVSQYGKSFVIGRNCRFLQGPETSQSSVARLIEALKGGREVTETLLNYRRDGTPFLNLLMIAPLYDNKGAVRYYLGAQIDVSSLIERGRGFESFESLLAKDRVDSRLGHRNQSRDAQSILADLGAMLNTDELSIIRDATARDPEGNVISATAQSRTNTMTSTRTSTTATVTTTTTKNGRRILGMDESTAADRNLWPQKSLGPSGRLPGVYQNYLLVRPYPSLRITFTSPALRIPGLLQTKFMDRIAGPQHVREGILDAISSGTSVTAKINWLPLSSERTGMQNPPRQRWIHCTPLLGADDKVGVWMVVMVENEEVTGKLQHQQQQQQLQHQLQHQHSRRLSNVDSEYRSIGSSHARPTTPGPAMSNRLTSEKLYQDYLRREGREGVVDTFSSSSSARG